MPGTVEKDQAGRRRGFPVRRGRIDYFSSIHRQGTGAGLTKTRVGAGRFQDRNTQASDIHPSIHPYYKQSQASKQASIRRPHRRTHETFSFSFGIITSLCRKELEGIERFVCKFPDQIEAPPRSTAKCVCRNSQPSPRELVERFWWWASCPFSIAWGWASVDSLMTVELTPVPERQVCKIHTFFPCVTADHTSL